MEGERGYNVYDSLLFSLTSRALEKLRGLSGSATPGGHRVKAQYGVSLALAAATRQTDHTLQEQVHHGKSTV